VEPGFIGFLLGVWVPALDLMSTYEGEHKIFGLLGQANLTQNDVLQFHPFTSK
jgi:hypothetical protein